jgi:hypothetical protein
MGIRLKRRVVVPLRLVHPSELLQQRPLESVIASHHPLRVDRAVLVGGISGMTDRLGCFIPLLQERSGQLLEQLRSGLLPGRLSAVAPPHHGLTRAPDREGFAYDCLLLLGLVWTVTGCDQNSEAAAAALSLVGRLVTVLDCGIGDRLEVVEA